MKKCPSHQLKRVSSSELKVITQDKEFKSPHLNDKFLSSTTSEFLGSSKSRLSQKENFDLNRMSSQDLKKSVESNPFMRAKLKYFIRTTQKSLGKHKNMSPPQLTPKHQFSDQSNMFCARVVEKQRLHKQKMRMADFEKYIKQNEKKSRHLLVVGSNKENIN